MGAEGGRETFRKYGRKHFSEIGKRGFQRFTDKYFGGIKRDAIDYLHLQATERKINDLVEKQMAETGDTCVELPVLLQAIP